MDKYLRESRIKRVLARKRRVEKTERAELIAVSLFGVAVIAYFFSHFISYANYLSNV